MSADTVRVELGGWRGGLPRSATHHRSSQDETESHGLFASFRGNRWTAIIGSAAVQPSAVSAGMPLCLPCSWLG